MTGQSTSRAADPAAINHALRLLLEDGQVTELRALGVSTRDYRRPHTVSGYFDDPAALAQAAAALDGTAKGIYIVPNPINPSLLARAANRVRTIEDREPLTSDSDIRVRRWLLIDADPRRASGISSTAAEHEAALRCVRTVCDVLGSEGWPDPVIADSGNGAHLLYRVDLPSNDGGLIKSVLEALSFRFDDEVVGVDQAVFNPARIWKLYGTTARKGDDLPERPHRGSCLLAMPADDHLVPVSSVLLEALAAMAPKPSVFSQRDVRSRHQELEIGHWLASHGLDVIGPAEWQGGARYILRVCPWNPSHQDRSAYIVQFPSGAVAAGCLHSSCRIYDWHALRDVIEPGWKASGAKALPVGAPATSASSDASQRRSQADLLVEIASATELFHDGASDTYARVAVSDHWECWPTRSKGFKRWLDHQFYRQFHKVANGEAMNNAIRLLEAQAQYDGECRDVHLRVASDGHGGIYVDLADANWRVVHVTEQGWRIEGNPPVNFRRPAGMLPLPAPVRGGTLDELRELVNVQDESCWTLIKAWLRSAIRPDCPYPILTLHGEQGSAKSSLARMLRGLFDPATPDLRSDPRELRDLSIAARSSWLLGFDNVSSIPQWLSDALCRLATGGGWATRELYTDFDEVLFEARRPILLNGITEYIVRGDLLDRTVQATLREIEDEIRRDERELWAAYEVARPRILGGLLDNVVAALGTLPTVQLARLPRMADFALWSVAAERGSDEPPAFMSAYMGARAETHIQAVEGSLIGAPLQRFIDEELVMGPWEGTATQLLERLKTMADEAITRRRGWPTSGRGLSGELRRLAPALRALDVRVDFDLRAAKGTRLIRVESVGKSPSQPSPPSPHASAPGQTGDAGDGCDGPIPPFAGVGQRRPDGDSQHPPANSQTERERFAI